MDIPVYKVVPYFVTLLYIAINLTSWYSLLYVAYFVMKYEFHYMSSLVKVRESVEQSVTSALEKQHCSQLKELGKTHSIQLMYVCVCGGGGVDHKFVNMYTLVHMHYLVN